MFVIKRLLELNLMS